MNFLSHYYFERHKGALNILGSLLPDLIKNAGNFKVANPLKQPELFDAPELLEILAGWQSHIFIDKRFHAAPFFIRHTQLIKPLILSVTERSEVRPSFLAHISLELLLDHLLITQNKVQVNHLYTNLQQADKEVVRIFLEYCEIAEPEKVLDFIKHFISSKYLISYQKTENIAYALNRICMRLWPEALDEVAVQKLHIALENHLHNHSTELLAIFPDLEEQLKELNA